VFKIYRYASVEKNREGKGCVGIHEVK